MENNDEVKHTRFCHADIGDHLAHFYEIRAEELGFYPPMMDAFDRKQVKIPCRELSSLARRFAMTFGDDTKKEQMASYWDSKLKPQTKENENGSGSNNSTN